MFLLKELKNYNFSLEENNNDGFWLFCEDRHENKLKYIYKIKDGALECVYKASRPLNAEETFEEENENYLEALYLERNIVGQKQIENLPELCYECFMCGESCKAGYDVEPKTALTWVKQGNAVLWDKEQKNLGVECQLNLSMKDGICTQLLQVPQTLQEPQDKTGNKNLCKIHLEYGEHHKPISCISFPYKYFLIEDSIRISIQWECTKLHKSLQESKYIKNYANDLISSKQNLYVVSPSPSIPSGDKVLISLKKYRSFERYILEKIDATPLDQLDNLIFSIPIIYANFLHNKIDKKENDASKYYEENFYYYIYSIIKNINIVFIEKENITNIFSKSDTRNIYTVWIMDLFNAILSQNIALNQKKAPPPSLLLKVYLKNQIWGMSLWNYQSLFIGVIDIILRYFLVRAATLLNPKNETHNESYCEELFSEYENKYLVIVEHRLRAVFMKPIYADYKYELEGWLISIFD